MSSEEQDPSRSPSADRIHFLSPVVSALLFVLFVLQLGAGGAIVAQRKGWVQIPALAEKDPAMPRQVGRPSAMHPTTQTPDGPPTRGSVFNDDLSPDLGKLTVDIGPPPEAPPATAPAPAVTTSPRPMPTAPPVVAPPPVATTPKPPPVDQTGSTTPAESEDVSGPNGAHNLFKTKK